VLSVWAVLSAAGCPSGETASGDGDAGSRVTGGNTPDAANPGQTADASVDASKPKDAGVPIDSGNPRDAGAPQDSGSQDAGAIKDAGPTPSDAGSIDAAVSCSHVLCEDFESGSLAGKPWTLETSSSSNSVQVQSARVAHGKYAVQAHAKGGSSYAVMFLENLPAALQKHYFGRMYYYATDFPTESGGHTAFITSSNTLKGFPDADHHLEVASYTGSKPTWQMTYWQGDGPEYIGSGGQIPKAKWFCLEWEFNDAPDEIAVWVDGQGSPQGAEFRNIDNHASNLLGKMTTLGVGFRTWHPKGAPDIDIYIDDIALDTQRVGCME
jgi:hypothetical protein